MITNEKIKVLSLFSGIGAPEKALQRLNIPHEIVNYCEIDKYASKSYSILHNISEDKNLGDITAIEIDKLPKFDMVFHGSPCQSFSVAGKGEGGDLGSNTRSSLMWNTVEIVKVHKPKYVIWENVPNVLSKKHKHNFDQYIDSLEELGYTSYYKLLNSKDFGIPQNRNRLFVVSILGPHEVYEFPTGRPLEIRLKDILEDSVEEKYYVNNERADKLIQQINKQYLEKKGILISEQATKFDRDTDVANCLLARDWKGFGNQSMTAVLEPFRLGGLFDDTGKHQAGSVYDTDGVCPTLDTMQGGWRQPCIIEPKLEVVGSLRGTGMPWDKRHESICRVYDPNGISPTISTCQGGGTEPKILEPSGYVEKKYKEFVDKNGYIPQLFNPYHCKEVGDIAPTQTTNCGGTTSSASVLKLESTADADKYRIRKLTPRECWRLQAFDDSDITKLQWKKETAYIEGGLKCNAKLKTVSESQRRKDMETYASCTINDLSDMAMLISTEMNNELQKENLEKPQNVNIAIEMLGEVVHLECATNIIRWKENTDMLYTMMQELDQHHMVIIELENKGRQNIGRFMKITSEENLPVPKLFIISTLIEQIIQSKIYTCISQKANIQGYISIVENCSKNSLTMKLLNLKMEYITERMSNTALYKMAGNSITVAVLEEVFKKLFKIN